MRTSSDARGRATDDGDDEGRVATRGNDDEAPLLGKDEVREDETDVDGGKEGGRRGSACRWTGRSAA